MARIDRVEIIEFRHEVENLGVDSSGFARVFEPGTTANLNNYAIAISADDGSRGEYCAMMCVKQIHLAQALRLAPNLIGRDPDSREQIYDDFKHALQAVAFVGVGPIDICLWDMAGKRAGTSVSRLLGRYRDRLRPYVSAMRCDRNGGLSSPEAVVEFAEDCELRGYRAFKFRGWSEGDPRETAACVEALGRRFNGDMSLMIDPGGDLRTFADALFVGRACDDAGFFWYEDPFRDTGTAQLAHRKLRQSIRTPLLISEHVRGLEQKASWITAEATDFVRADPELDMGITGCMKIAHLAEAFGLDVEIHGAGPAHRACMSAIRNTNFYELCLIGPQVGNFLSPPVFANGYSDQLDAIGNDGFVPVPDGPGLGVEYDWEFINKNAVNVYEFN